MVSFIMIMANFYSQMESLLVALMRENLLKALTKAMNYSVKLKKKFKKKRPLRLIKLIRKRVPKKSQTKLKLRTKKMKIT
jgi:hypothetical protein